MEVQFILTSGEFFTQKQESLFYENKITYNWDCPILPRKDELIEDDIVLLVCPKNMESHIAGLSFTVSCVMWDFKDGKIIPTIWLHGE